MAKFFSGNKKSMLLLLSCICFLVIGAGFLFLGALAHINPRLQFSGLFAREPLMNLIYSILPPFS